MSLTAVGASVIGSMFHGHAGEIDQMGFRPEWLESDLDRIVASAQISLSRQHKVVNHLNVLSLIDLKIGKDDWAPIIRIAQNGYGDVDPIGAVRAARDRYLYLESQRVARELQSLSPDNVVGSLSALSQRLSAALNQGQAYESRPSKIYEQDSPDLLFESSIPEINTIIRGGYHQALIIYNGVSGHGKSTIMFTHIADGVRQGRMCALVVNERPVREALNRILRGLSGLSASEVSKRQGSDPKRHEILMEWLKVLDSRLRIYDVSAYSESGLESIVRWDQPDLLCVDYLRDVPGMLNNRSSRDPVGDMAYAMLGLTTRSDSHCCVITGGQMSQDHATRFKKYDGHVVDILYGSARPYHASNIFIGLKRHNTIEDVGLCAVWKDNIGNEINTIHELPFDSHRWVFTSLGQSDYTDIQQ